VNCRRPETDVDSHTPRILGSPKVNRILPHAGHPAGRHARRGRHGEPTKGTRYAHTAMGKVRMGLEDYCPRGRGPRRCRHRPCDSLPWHWPPRHPLHRRLPRRPHRPGLHPRRARFWPAPGQETGLQGFRSSGQQRDRPHRDIHPRGDTHLVPARFHQRLPAGRDRAPGRPGSLRETSPEAVHGQHESGPGGGTRRREYARDRAPAARSSCSACTHRFRHGLPCGQQVLLQQGPARGA
jgi:hypothetical protein